MEPRINLETKYDPRSFVREHPSTSKCSDLETRLAFEDDPWQAGETSVSDFPVEMKKRLACTITHAPEHVDVLKSVRAEFPSKWDWRDREGVNYVTPVRSQGSCGSCWAFSAVATMESAVLIATGSKVDLSEQHLVSKCSGSGSCGGGWPDEALEYIRDSGIPPEDCFKYQGRSLPCSPCDNWESLVWRIRSFKSVQSTTAAFKEALTTHGPISVVLTAPDDLFYYRGGVYEPIMDVDGVGWANHAVLLVGYNDAGGYWIVKNSWGSGWGDHGYAKVKYGVLEGYNYAYVITELEKRGDDGDETGVWSSPVTAESSSCYGDGYHARNAIDELEDTHWFSESGAEHPMLSMRLSERRNVDAVRFETYPRDLPMKVSVAACASHGGSWRIIAGATLTNPVEVVEFEKVAMEFVQVVFTPQNRAYGTCTDFKVRLADDGDDEDGDDGDDLVLDRVTIIKKSGDSMSVQDRIKSVVITHGDKQVLSFENPVE